MFSVRYPQPNRVTEENIFGELVHHVLCKVSATIAQL
jgi:hypothetical protein